MSNATLAAELANDPLGLGLAALSNAAAAAKLNDTTLRPLGTAPLIVPTYKIYNAIVPIEFIALSAANQQLVRDILAMGTVDASAGTNVRAVLLAKFPSGTATFTNFAALAATFATTQSRAQEMGLGAVSDTDVGACR